MTKRVDELETAEWLPIATAPSDKDLEICVMDYDQIVQALEYPCQKTFAAEWVDTANKKRVDIQPTHWRQWTKGRQLPSKSKGAAASTR